MEKLLISENLLSQIGDEGVIFLLEINKYFSLNETMYKIVSAVKLNKSVSEIVSSMCEEYEIAEDYCKREVQAAIDELIRNGIIHKSN